MSEAKLVKPDLAYVKEVMAAGGESLKKCYQCATCSVVCELAPDGKPFPRKEMVWAQWGQKEKLVNNADVWLCHQCSDCTAKCPRDAKPGEVLSAVRRTAYRHFAWPSFMGGLFANTASLPIIFAIPVLLLLAVIAVIGNFSPDIDPEVGIVFGNFLGIVHNPIPGLNILIKEIPAVDLVFVPFAALALFSAFVSLNEFWKGLDSQVPPSTPRKGFGPAASEFVGELISHATFKKCVASAGRSTAHQLVLFGFVGLFITTNIVLVYEYLFHWPTPLSLFSAKGFVPKIIGTVSGAALMVGWFLMRKNRSENAENNPMSSYDSIFLWVVGLVGITGFASWFIRLSGIAPLAYLTYFIHLVLVFYIIAYLPFSKLAHILYRSVAIIHAKSTGRDALAVIRPAAPAEVEAPAETEAPAEAAT